jgi:hypothetical protein
VGEDKMTPKSPSEIAREIRNNFVLHESSSTNHDNLEKCINDLIITERSEVDRLRLTVKKMREWIEWAVACMNDAGDNTGLLQCGQELLSDTQGKEGDK